MLRAEELRNMILAELQRETKKEEDKEDKLASMYKSQDRPLDIDSYSLIPSRY